MPTMTGDRDIFTSRCGAPMRGGKKCILTPGHARYSNCRAKPRSPLEEAAAAALATAEPRQATGDALCAQTDPELFFSDKAEDVDAAKKVCARCPIRAQCLEGALASHERHGVWGGTTETERYAFTA